MTKDEALKLALEALVACIDYIPNNTVQGEKDADLAEEAITAIKAALEAKDEPVAWREFDGEGGYDYYTYEHNEDLRDKYIERNGEKYASWVEPLYTTPPQRTWDELTLAEVKEAYNQHAKYQIEDIGVSGWINFADALQTILRSKNT